MLDLAGYTEDRELSALRIVEPACGDGAFLVEIVRRLLRTHPSDGSPQYALQLRGAIAAYDIDEDAVRASRRRVAGILATAGVSPRDAADLAHHWVRQSDYLLTPQEPADIVVGNPPYVRPEEVDSHSLDAYRRRWQTMVGRADLYVGFLEASMMALNHENSRLVFICPDRWMVADYGRELRRFISEQFSIELAIQLHEVALFDKKVDAYPAIVVIGRDKSAPFLQVRTQPGFDANGAQQLGDWLVGANAGPPNSVAVVRSVQPSGERSWHIHREPGRPSVANGRPLSATCAVGVGMATGADAIYFTAAAPVEEALLDRAVSPEDLRLAHGWRGSYFINPWVDGELVALDKYPLFREYVMTNRPRLARRRIARDHPDSWWRTIDKPRADYSRPKLLLPDLAHGLSPYLDTQGLVPKHTVFYIWSENWDLETLGGLLLSRTVEESSLAPMIRFAGGHLRLTTRYLRNLVLPAPETISVEDRENLSMAFRARDREAADAIARRYYRTRSHRAGPTQRGGSIDA